MTSYPVYYTSDRTPRNAKLKIKIDPSERFSKKHIVLVVLNLFHVTKPSCRHGEHEDNEIFKRPLDE